MRDALPPPDNMALCFGLLLLGTLFLQIWQAWELPFKQRKFLAQNPDDHLRIKAAFDAYRRGRFSRLCQLSYGAWLLLALATLISAFLSGHSPNGLVSRVWVCFLSVSCLLTGIHCYRNGKFIAIPDALSSAAEEHYDFTFYRPDGGEWNNSMGLLLIGLSFFGLSCVLFDWPFSSLTLTRIFHSA